MPEESVLEPTEQADSQDGAARLVPVAESIKYRRRAQQAESRLQEVEQQLQDIQAQFDLRSDELAAAEAQRDEAKHAVIVAEDRAAAQRMLAESGVVDLEAACMLLERRANFGDGFEEETLARNVEQLLLDKPFLRNTIGSYAGSLPPRSASPKGTPESPAARLALAAEQAAQSGGRRDVADYLRLRRQAALSRE